MSDMLTSVVTPPASCETALVMVAMSSVRTFFTMAAMTMRWLAARKTSPSP